MTASKRSQRQMDYMRRRMGNGLCSWGGCKDPLVEIVVNGVARKLKLCAKHRTVVNDRQRARWRRLFGKVKPVAQTEVKFGEAK